MRGRCDIERCRRLLVTPVVYGYDVPIFTWHVGQPDGWSWEGLSPVEEREGRYFPLNRMGCVYFARGTDHVKIGFAQVPGDRIWVQQLDPALVIQGLQQKHESLLHRFFVDERIRVRSDRFCGPRIELFIRLASERSRSGLAEWPVLSGYRGLKAQQYLDDAEGEAA